MLQNNFAKMFIFCLSLALTDILPLPTGDAGSSYQLNSNSRTAGSKKREKEGKKIPHMNFVSDFNGKNK